MNEAGFTHIWITLIIGICFFIYYTTKKKKAEKKDNPKEDIRNCDTCGNLDAEINQCKSIDDCSMEKREGWIPIKNERK